MTAVISVAEEGILKFMTGAVEITDANWDAYVADVENSGLQACLDVQQSAYEAYLRGERTIAASSSGGPGGPPPDGGGAPPEGPPPRLIPLFRRGTFPDTWRLSPAILFDVPPRQKLAATSA